MDRGDWRWQNDRVRALAWLLCALVILSAIPVTPAAKTCCHNNARSCPMHREAGGCQMKCGMHADLPGAIVAHPFVILHESEPLRGITLVAGLSGAHSLPAVAFDTSPGTPPPRG